MPWDGVAAHAAALVLYPGGLTIALAAAVREAAAARRLPDLRRHWLPAIPTALPIAVLPAVAMAEVAAPFNPVARADRNLLVAAVALTFASALPWVTAARPRAGGFLLSVQLSWLVALLAPALDPESLRPQVLGALVVPALIPVKIAAAMLYLLCLPALVDAIPRQLDAARSSSLLWLPYCALFVSLFLPPRADDLAGLVSFWIITIVVGAATFGMALLLRRSPAPAPSRLYHRAVGPFAWIVVGLAAVTALLR
jgi:hypothetical protein